MAYGPNLNYFTCTLGESMILGLENKFQNINDLIFDRSATSPNDPAIGFFQKPKEIQLKQLDPQLLTFRQLLQGIFIIASTLTEFLTVGPEETVGLLCSSSPEFLFTWLACVLLGNPVLIIAPECSPLGITSLCASCGVTKILVDPKNEDLALQATQVAGDAKSAILTYHRLPFDEDEVFKNARSTTQTEYHKTSPKRTDVAYYHHTSGTSSGLPKPIPQSHYGTVGALPAFRGEDSATFTTTPLFHGGPADILRAWSSCAMIWLFPSQHMPITSSNVVRCLDCASYYAESTGAPQVKFFASVPYILQLMRADSSGLRWLQSMDLVGVGGAALPQQIGDELVDHGVHLVSRYGSAECGFLLSSHRDYEHDKDWQYLRLPKSLDCPLLIFENREDSLSELIVQSHWPHMAKRNRQNGEYATCDLFSRHSNKEYAWKYHSRADAQFTLVTGKKFDPSVIESKLVAASSLLADVLVFGNNKVYPGVLLFRAPSAVELSDGDFLDEITPIIKRTNSENLTHARIPAHMVIPMPYSENPLEKSSKGSILRGKSEEKYSRSIENAYIGSKGEVLGQCKDEELPQAINRLICSIISESSSLDNDTDLFSFGVDSVACMQIRSRLVQYLPNSAPELPINVVENCATVDNLAKYILALRHGDDITTDVEDVDSPDLMLQLVEKYSTFPEYTDCTKDNNENETIVMKGVSKETILLTGATGALGAHVLDQLTRHPGVTKIYCLVRGANSRAAYERVAKALQYRQLKALDGTSPIKIVVLRAMLSNPRLGLEDDTYHRIANDCTIILHLAWSVNFRMTLRSFEKDNFSGLKNLIDLALSSPKRRSPHFVFCSSVASATNHDSTSVPEEILENPASASSSGYSQSKWVAEQICCRASVNTRLKGHMSILRVGQLSGDSTTGIWNAKEAWPLMLSTVKFTRSLPELSGEVLDWLPINIGAAAVVESAFQSFEESNLRVYHILNNNTRPNWQTFLGWLRERVDFEIVPPKQWIVDVTNMAERKADHPTIQLLDHWKRALTVYGDGQVSSTQRKVFSMDRTRKDLPALQEVQPLCEDYLEKIWTWIDREM